MRLWIKTEYVNASGKTVHAERAVKATVSEMITDINRKAASRGVRAVNELRSAELRVLKGQRSGKRYRKPYTGSLTLEERRKKKYRPPMYTASAPGEAPARRTGNLRLHWNGQVKTESAARKGISVIAELESQEKYASFLENGTSKMAPRPFIDRIKEGAMPEIRKIYSEPFK